MKRKSEKEKYDEDLNELKKQQEGEIKSLRERYKKNIGIYYCRCLQRSISETFQIEKTENL